MNGVFGVNFSDFSVGKLDESIEVERVKIEEKENAEEKLPEYDLPCLEDLFQGYRSGLGLDIAKNHTGIAIWENGKLTTNGFKIKVNWEKDDKLALAKLRRAFKVQLWEFLELREFEIVVVEDVYSGKNFLTVKTLILLNEVVKQFILLAKWIALHRRESVVRRR